MEIKRHAYKPKTELQKFCYTWQSSDPAWPFVNGIWEDRPWFITLFGEISEDFYLDEDTPSFSEIRQDAIPYNRPEYPEFFLLKSDDLGSASAFELYDAKVQMVIRKEDLDINCDIVEVVISMPDLSIVKVFKGYLDSAWSIYEDLRRQPGCVLRILNDMFETHFNKGEDQRIEQELLDLKAMQLELDDVMLDRRADFGGF